MPKSRKRKSQTPNGIQARRQKALFLPMPREDAESLVLRTRTRLERVRNGEANRMLVNSLGLVVLFTNWFCRGKESGSSKGDMRRMAYETNE
ncbi:hypothetical protein [Paraburkholderia sediminicola]|uniref:hypothetical protein n=1 Tax=Paraburkholderia sediminicola TaxID=458836 RepID=UPI0038BB9870